MKEVYLGFQAYDIHEMLCHAMAAAGGLYKKAGLSVKLLDTSFLPDEALPENAFHVTCGAALSSFLLGRKRKIVFVACDRPMFWLYGRPGVETLDQLAKGRVATFPDNTPPSRFLHKLLSDAGISTGLLPSRDDATRLAMLASSSVDGALISSRIMPAEVERHGCNLLAYVGDNMRLPSAGLALSGELFDEQPVLVGKMVHIYRQAIKCIFNDDDTLLRRVLVDQFSMPKQFLQQTMEVIRSCYNPFGYSYDSVLQSAVENTAAGMGLTASSAPNQLYEFQCIKSYN